MSKTVLVIPDSHADPGESNERYLALGKYILEVKPDLIVNLGDMADMASLSSYDKGKISAEGKRYKDDVAVTREANELLFRPIHEFNQREIRAGRSPYLPQLELTTGNHEFRVVRAASEAPELWGWVSLDDLEYEKAGWNVHPYKTIFKQDGLSATHHFCGGSMDRPLGGTGHARTLTLLDGTTAIQGHTHGLQMYRNGRGTVRYGIVAGCFFNKKVSYVSPDAQQDWWRGITVLYNFGVNGPSDCDPVFVPMNHIMEYL